MTSNRGGSRELPVAKVSGESPLPQEVLQLLCDRSSQRICDGVILTPLFLLDRVFIYSLGVGWDLGLTVGASYWLGVRG